MSRFRFFSPAALAACLLAACQHDPAARQEPPHMPRGPYATSLRVDWRYLDSASPKQASSQYFLRQMFIWRQLRRLKSIRKEDSLAAREGRPDTTQIQETYTPKLRLLPSGRFLVDTAAQDHLVFPNRAAELADIRRQIDALEALERAHPLPR